MVDFNKKPIQKKKLPISAPNQYRNRGDTVNQYFKISDAKNFAFYKVPKALFEEKYKSVSTDAKMLYGLLLDRMYLSVKNGWIDNQGRVYQYFTIKSAQENCISVTKKYVNCSRNLKLRT